MTKQTVVLWSGGYDSTIALYEEAKQSCKNNPVIAVSINHANLTQSQHRMEKKARDKLMKEFKKRGLHIKHHEIKVDTDLISDGNLNQPTWWLGTLVPFLPRDSIVVFGYIRGDDFWHINYEFKQAADWLCRTMYKKVKISFPNEFFNKQRILDELTEAKLFDLCWTCDKPIKSKPCGNCSKCDEIKNYTYVKDRHVVVVEK